MLKHMSMCKRHIPHGLHHVLVIGLPHARQRHEMPPLPGAHRSAGIVDNFALPVSGGISDASRRAGAPAACSISSCRIQLYIQGDFSVYILHYHPSCIITHLLCTSRATIHPHYSYWNESGVTRLATQPTNPHVTYTSHVCFWDLLSDTLTCGSLDPSKFGCTVPRGEVCPVRHEVLPCAGGSGVGGRCGGSEGAAVVPARRG